MSSPWLTLFALVTVVLTDVSGELHDVRTLLHAAAARLEVLAKHPRATDVARIAEALGTARRALVQLAGRLEGLPKVFFSDLTDPPPPAEIEAAEGVLEDIRAELQAVRLEDLEAAALKGIGELRAFEREVWGLARLDDGRQVHDELRDRELFAEVARDVAHAARAIDKQADRLAAERDRLHGAEKANAAAAELEGNEAIAAAEVAKAGDEGDDGPTEPTGPCWLCHKPGAPIAQPYAVVDGATMHPEITPPTWACDEHMPAGDRVVGWRRPGETVRRAAAPASAEAVA